MGIRIIIVCIIIIISFIALHNFVGRVVFKNELPTLFGYGVTSLRTSTIDDEYKMGDLVLIQKEEEYSKGDYIIYNKDNKEVIELITDQKDDYYVTISNKDGAIYEINKGFPKAKVVGAISKLGSFSSFLTSAIGIFVVFFLIILFMFSSR